MHGLPPDVAKRLTNAHNDFESGRVNLVGTALAEAYAQLGAFYIKEGFPASAAVAFYDATQLNPKDARWWYVSGVVAHQQNKDAQARTDFETALSIDKIYLPIRLRLADLLAAQGDLDGARKMLLDATTDNPDRGELFAFLGRTELKQRRYDDAITHLQQALKTEPQATSLYKDLADAYQGKGENDQAQAARAKAGDGQPVIADPIVTGIYVASHSLTPPPSDKPIDLARQFMNQQQFAMARNQLEVSLKANPNDIEALALAARLDALLGRSDAAQDEARRALKIDANDASANLSQGMAYEFAGDDAKAQPFYQRAAKANPNLPDVHLLLGNALMRRSRFAEAAEEYRKLVVVDPSSIDGEGRLAAALVAAGRCRDAINGISSALSARARDGDLMQIFVRLAATCNAATQQERAMALDYGQALYTQRPDAVDTVALALAQAANGKFDDAQKSQAEAIFEAERAHDRTRANAYRETMRLYAAHKIPDHPWPADHPYLKPSALVVLDSKTKP
jgi:tetratricopeptide (TPR) repeat protein